MLQCFAHLQLVSRNDVGAIQCEYLLIGNKPTNEGRNVSVLIISHGSERPVATVTFKNKKRKKIFYSFRLIIYSVHQLSQLFLFF